jgi:hypothetical protein
MCCHHRTAPFTGKSVGGSRFQHASLLLGERDIPTHDRHSASRIGTLEVPVVEVGVRCCRHSPNVTLRWLAQSVAGAGVVGVEDVAMHRNSGSIIDLRES